MRRWRTAAAGALVVAGLCIGMSAPSPAAADCIIPAELLPAPARLFHGTWREGFTPAGRHVGLWQFPPGPAWFAPERDFSLHAPLRYPQAEVITLFSYRLVRPLRLIYCDTADDAAEYAVARGLAADRRREDGAVAATICAGGNHDGYRILEDRVRGEVEYVLCAPERVLRLFKRGFWQVQPRTLSGVQGRMARQGSQRVWLADYDLTCFVRLPQQPRQALCPDHGTMPRIDCCPPPTPPPRINR